MKKSPLTLLIAGLAAQLALAADPADRVLINGDIYTVDSSKPTARAIAIDDGKIVFVGSDEEVEKYIGKDTQVEDLDGDFVLPGFIDTHAHFTTGAVMSKAVRLKLGDSVEQWKKDIKAFAEDHPDQKGILGLGIYALRFGKNGPTKEELDELVPDRPAVIMDEGGHSAWFNSKALEMAGITKDTPDPVPGVHMYQRKPNGEPSGWNKEAMTIFPLVRKLKLISPEMVEEGAEEIFELLPAIGLTTYYDAGMMQMEDMMYPALASLEKKGKLSVKVVGSYMVQSPAQVHVAIDKIKDYKKKYASDLIRPSTIKIHNDGTLEAKTAALHEDYSNEKGHKGGILLEGSVLKHFVADIARNDIHAHIHAIGDKTITEGLDAVEFARKEVPDSKSRFSIAHVVLIQDEDTPRFGQLDIVAQTTPAWITTEDIDNPDLGTERSKKRYRIQSIENGGAKVTFGSDFPVGGEFGLYPFYNIEVGMTRKGFDEDSKVLPYKNEKMSLESMIKGYTINAAYQLGMEDEIGSITVGKAADIIVLSENLFKIKPGEIHDVKVKETIMNGKTAYERKWYYRLMGY
ncbi:MAG: hydrolase [Proteobacteria bacterium]|nr:MAG: hydrolase [Pseudomonadota bacterium]PIE39894.1 MAG: hydrolase [Gammaproteobacteria bacterium]